MTRTALLLASLLALWVSPSFAQVVVSRPVVTYYAPAAPVVTYYAPTVSAPVTMSRTTYYSPAVDVAPVTSYYAPATSYVVPTTTYYSPVTSYYTPVTTYYGGTVVTPVYDSSVVVGRSAYGTLRPYVPGQPVRNTLRFTLP